MESKFKVSSEKIAEVISLLTAVYNSADEKTYLKAKALLEKAAVSITQVKPIRADQVPLKRDVFYPTGTDWYDEWIGGGLRRKEILIYGAVPFSGKTHLLIWTASQYLKQGATVAHFFGEDLQIDVRDYYAAAAGKKPLKNLWLMDMQDYTFSMREVETVLESMEVKPDIVVFDHMDLMQSSSFSHGDWESAAGVVREMKIFAKRNDNIVLSASQAHPKTREQQGISRFYRAKIGKAANADLVLMVDDVVDDEYRMVRTKARGRSTKRLSEAKKILTVDWDKMIMEDIT